MALNKHLQSEGSFSTTICDAVSLFSGCGGSDLGLIRAGIQPAWANDSCEAACELYDSITKTKNVIHHADIENVRTFPKAEVLVGCYPCQGYSQAGKRDTNASINYLYRHFDRALRQIRPRAFIVENVDGMRFRNNAPLLRAQLVRFRSAGYAVNWKVLNASDYGVPQSRKRLFIVGIQSAEKKRFEFPPPSHGTQCNPRKTLRDTISHLRTAPPGSYNDEAFHWYYLSRNRRRDWDQQAPCVVAHWRHVGIHPDSPNLVKIGTDRWVFENDAPARRFSYLECAAIQGFPNPHDFNLRLVRERFRAIGNAVPPPLFEAVAKALTRQIRG